MEKCNNCNAKIGGLLNSNDFLGHIELEFINKYSSENYDELCNKCSKGIYDEAKRLFRKKRDNLSNFLKDYIHTFPILTISDPQGWNYKSIGIVTAQSTMSNKIEAGIIDNLLGINQNVVDLDSSVNRGEKNCFNILRQKAKLLKANAIFGVDIDYQEFGLKGELMLVCMAGTAVYVENLTEISEEYAEFVSKYKLLTSTIKSIEKYSKLVK